MHALPPSGYQARGKGKSKKDRERERERVSQETDEENGMQRGAEGCKRRRNGNSEKSRASETETRPPSSLSLSLLSLSLSLSRVVLPGLPERASRTTILQSYPVGRFTYKFNKHISYLMHALSRECFDRPGPSSSPFTRLWLALDSLSSPRGTFRRALIAHFLRLLNAALLGSNAGSTGGCCLLRDCLPATPKHRSAKPSFRPYAADGKQRDD